MNRSAKILWMVTSAALLVACQDPPAGTGGGVGLETNVEGPALPVDHPNVAISKPIQSAYPQRLRVGQLRGILPSVMGTEVDGGVITWKVGSTPGLDTYGDTLGEADYLNITEDNLEPSPLYLKFMDDAARDVCSRALNADYIKIVAADRTILRFADKAQHLLNAPAAIDANLRYLKLRFHGIKVDATNDSEIAGLRTMFSQVTLAAAGTTSVDSNDIKEGWRAVCVSLVMAPEFHFY